MKLVKTEDLNIEYIEELADIVMSEIDIDDDEKSISIIGKYEEIKEVLKAIIAGYDVDIMGLELPYPDWDNTHDMEYDLSVWSSDGEITISCEAIQRNGEYLNLEGDILYIFDDCSSKILQKACYRKVYSVSVGEDEECDCGECCVECSKTEDGDVHGFTASKSDGNGYYSFSFYTSDILGKEDIHSMLKQYGF